MGKILNASLLAAAGIAVAAQLARPERTNPPVVSEPPWDSPQTRELARRACFDCHSNQTTWPWYSQVAPVSWLVVGHVNEGREKLNFSDYDGTEESDELVDEIREGEMPLWDYKLAHGGARLTPAETDSLVAGLQRTFDGLRGDSTAVSSAVRPDTIGHKQDEHEERETD